ncbi:hypothetical protein JHK85_044226 [Glycine max]|nr:hypothetical protein JHK85_044226 [Glycine max]
MPLGQSSSQLSGFTQLSPNDAFLLKAEAKSISHINAILEEIVCVTVGTITKIMMDNHSWCYLACSRCHKKTDIGVVPFTCGFGKHNDQPVLRYQVEVMVKDKDEDTKFLL